MTIHNNRFQVHAEPGVPETLTRLKLRYLSPKELSNLQGFPPSFQFPPDLTFKQCYRLLGNSLNVVVVQHLISYLFVLPLPHSPCQVERA